VQDAATLKRQPKILPPEIVVVQKPFESQDDFLAFIRQEIKKRYLRDINEMFTDAWKLSNDVGVDF
jgi:hypothetical protein